MHYSPNIRSAVVTGPLDDPLTLLGLPARSTTRWTALRKAEIVAAVEGGLMPSDMACAWYGLSLEELEEWQRATDSGGVPALRATCQRQPRERVDSRMAAFIHQ